MCIPMFFATIFTITEIWKQTKHLSMDKWTKKMWYIYTVEYYSAVRKKEILPFATTWIDLERIMLRIMLSEISQTEKDKYCMISPTCGI